MFCKLQHGNIESIWYLQKNKAGQGVECAFLDWCNLIWIQSTAKYKIRTKYNDNLIPINMRKVGRQHLCTQNQHTKGQRSKRERTTGKVSIAIVYNCDIFNLWTTCV